MKKEIFILSVLNNFSAKDFAKQLEEAKTTEVKTEEKKEAEAKSESQENCEDDTIKMSFPVEHSFESEEEKKEAVEYLQNMTDFLNLMNCKASEMTDEKLNEVFELFPQVIDSFGNFGKDVVEFEDGFDVNIFMRPKRWF